MCIRDSYKLQTNYHELQLMAEHRISGIPVVERSVRLAGILTNRDVRFARDPNQPVSELMTRDNLVTVREGVDMAEAKRLLHQHRIEKLFVVDDEYRGIGLITGKDIEKAQLHPNACKDDKGRLRAAAATGVGEDGRIRAEALIEAEADIVVVDTAHGHSVGVLDTVREIKRLSNQSQVIAGNVATPDGARALIDVGADAIKIGTETLESGENWTLNRCKTADHDPMYADRAVANAELKPTPPNRKGNASEC